MTAVVMIRHHDKWCRRPLRRRRDPGVGVAQCRRAGLALSPEVLSGERLDAQVRTLVENGELHDALRVPDAVGPIAIDADLRARQTTTSAVVDAPRESRPAARVNWLVRQLQD